MPAFLFFPLSSASKLSLLLCHPVTVFAAVVLLPSLHSRRCSIISSSFLHDLVFCSVSSVQEFAYSSFPHKFLSTVSVFISLYFLLYFAFSVLICCFCRFISLSLSVNIAINFKYLRTLSVFVFLYFYCILFSLSCFTVPVSLYLCPFLLILLLRIHLFFLVF